VSVSAIEEDRVSTALPPVARLGFDDGWLFLDSTFLNLQKPVLLVDQVHIGPSNTLGLEPFGSRNPRRGLPACRIEVGVVGNGVTLWTTRKGERSMLAAHWFAAAPDIGRICCASSQVVLIVGDTYAVGTSWSALWTCLIGSSQLQRAHVGVS